MGIYEGYYSSIIAFTIGVYSLLLGYGVISPPNKKGYKKKTYFLLGVLLVIFGVIRTILTVIGE